MRVFKNKWFARWARKEKISDAMLIEAVDEVSGGKVGADLGGFLFKKRLARAGEGKRGGYRVLVAYKKGKRIIFLYAFAKKERANIDDQEKAALMLVSKSLMAATRKQIEALIEKGDLYEVKK